MYLKLLNLSPVKTNFSDQILFLDPDLYASQGLNFSVYKEDILRFRDQWFLSAPPLFKIQTSGSTGQPKTIEISKDQMMASAMMTGKALGLTSSDNALVCLNTQFIAGKMMLARAFSIGMTAYILPPVANPLKTITKSHLVTFTAMVPYQMQTIIKESPDKAEVLDRMKAILLGGAPVSHPLEDALQSIEAPIYSTYGMTETVSHIALRRLNGPDASPVYTTLPGVSIELDERSCLTIRGPMTGNLTITTNDIVELIAPGQFIWSGRIDNVINSGGIKIQVEKLENSISKVFSSSGFTNRFIITGIPDKSFGTCVALLIEGVFSEDQKNKLYDKLIQTLPKYEIPKKLFALPQFMETATGKVDRLATTRLISTQTPA